jgi:hypothetical protein
MKQMIAPRLPGLSERLEASGSFLDVEESAADWAISYGPGVLASLDKILLGLS